MGSFKLIEGVTWADYAFQAEGKDLNDLFRNAGLALCHAMAELDTVKPKKEFKFELEHEDVERLLFKFLEEIVYLKDAEYAVFHDVDVKVTEGKPYKLKAVLHGEDIDTKKHTLHADVKAITFHKWEFEKTGKGYKCQVVVDT